MSGRINSTWGGNLVDMVRCQKLLEIIDEENLVENAAVMGDLFPSRTGKIKVQAFQHHQCAEARIA
jgi:L-lysine 6-transaminase